jgi:hypothetical protein
MLFDPNWKKPEAKVQLEPWRQLLLDAADYIEVNGWCQNDYHTHEGACALGALRMVSTGSTLLEPPARHDYMNYHVAKGYLQQAVGRHVPLWNDQKGTTKEDVITKMREVATARLSSEMI